uniref:Cathelicidin n=1 Tax=Chrysemys picta bellii TaxID=8478 RepID=A0A8C3HPA3_CHRPI
ATGHRMETCLKVLLLVGVVTAAPTPSSAPLPTHEDAVLAAVQAYNQEPGTTLAYRLLEAEPQPDWDASSKTIQPVTFTVKETVCLISEKRDPNQCEFKEDGVRITPCTETPPSVLLSLIPQMSLAKEVSCCFQWFACRGHGTQFPWALLV